MFAFTEVVLQVVVIVVMLLDVVIGAVSLGTKLSPKDPPRSSEEDEPRH